MAFAAPGGGNLRDLGGLRTIDGHVVRAGVLLRSEAPHTLGEPCPAQLAALPGRLIYPLRSQGERTPPPRLWVENSEPQVVHADLPTMLDENAGAAPFEVILSEG